MMPGQADSRLPGVVGLLVKTQTVLSYDLPKTSMLAQIELWKTDHFFRDSVSAPGSQNPINYRRLGPQLSKLDGVVMEWVVPTFQSVLVRQQHPGVSPREI